MKSDKELLNALRQWYDNLPKAFFSDEKVWLDAKRDFKKILDKVKEAAPNG